MIQESFKQLENHPMTNLADLQFCGFLSFEKGETCQSILSLLRGKITSSKKESVVCEALFYLK